MEFLLLGWVLGALPLLGLVLWWWNELRYVVPLKFRASNHVTAKLPPGHMGLPFVGELFTFLWYFKILRRPDDFINSKRNKYGDGVGLYRTYLFGSPSIIACFPMVSRFIFQSDDKFILEWPNLELMGRNSLVVVQGKAHSRLRSFVTNSINRPNALRLIAAHVQTRIVAALNSWAQTGKVKAYKEVKKVTFKNVGKLFKSFEPGPEQDAMDKLFNGLVRGIRVHPFNFPGSAYHYAVQCRNKLNEIFRVELEKKKKENGVGAGNDLMDGLMQMKDEEGNQLSDQEVLDNIVSLVIGGYESTSLASMWGIYYLAKYPDVVQKIRVKFGKSGCKNDYLPHQAPVDGAEVTFSKL